MISENIGTFWVILRMDAWVFNSILSQFYFAILPSCVRLFSFCRLDVLFKSWTVMCKILIFLAGALFFVAHSIITWPC
jgi:hypothetical protein